MSDTERLNRLERLLDKLCDALQRRGTEQEGGWGFQPFRDELRDIRDELARK